MCDSGEREGGINSDTCVTMEGGKEGGINSDTCVTLEGGRVSLTVIHV